MPKCSHHFRIITLVSVVLVIAAYVVFALTRPLPALAISVTQPTVPNTAIPNFPWPSYGQSAYGAAGYGVLAAHNPQSVVPMASTAKLLTALTVLQKQPLNIGEQGPMITITAQDVGFYQQYLAENGSVAQVTAGEQISEYQALQAMMLPSANNFAETLAVWAYGSNDAFLAAANALAQTDEATNTHLVDASGFDPGSVSTANNLVKLGLQVMANPVLAQIVGESTANIPVAGNIQNVNIMLGKAGINGVKTGNTDQAGGVFVASAPITIGGKTVTFVSAIMSAPDLGTALVDNVPLIKAASDAFDSTNIATKGQQFGSAVAPWGATTKLVAANTVSIDRWKGTAIAANVQKQNIKAPLSANTPAGTLTATAGTKTYATTIVAANSLGKPSLFWRLQHAL